MDRWMYRTDTGSVPTCGRSARIGICWVEQTYQRRILLGLYNDFGAYKNERPARVVTTDAGLNDYINDIFFVS